MLGGEADNEAMNAWLRSSRVVSIDSTLCEQGGVMYWTHCITSADGVPREQKRQGRPDYSDQLNEHELQVFNTLRDIRRQISVDDGIPAYAVFTDKELIEIAQLETITPATLEKLKGIGSNRANAYGRKLSDMYNATAAMSATPSPESGTSTPSNKPFKDSSVLF